MVTEVKMYEAKDGKLFKTKQGAQNHNRKEAANTVLESLGLTKEEISGKLQALSQRNFVVKSMLEHEPDWTKWEVYHILSIDKKLFAEPQKKTEYIKKYKGWGESKEEILFTEQDDDFKDPEMHCGDEWKVVGIEDTNALNRKVYLDYKYTWEERMLKKINSGEELNESEISGLATELAVVYEEEGEARRWSKSMLSVVELMGELFAVEWEKGLTENQEDSFYEQPYPVELETEEKIIKTIITTVVKK